jgi:CO/xanthine dehydrogenase Mo-binding subunit
MAKDVEESALNRAKNFIKKEQFPYRSAFGFDFDSGDYHTALDKVLEAVDYKGLRAEQAAKRADPNSPTLMGIGLVTFTEVVGAGPSKMCDILGVGMFDSCEIRIHPTGSAIARLGTISQGQGHATTFAQILASEIGLPADSITVGSDATASRSRSDWASVPPKSSSRLRLPTSSIASAIMVSSRFRSSASRSRCSCAVVSSPVRSATRLSSWTARSAT